MNGLFINKEVIEEWLNERFVEYAARHGSGYNKSLQVNLKGVWIVISWKSEIYRGEMDTAINTYNSILPKRN